MAKNPDERAKELHELLKNERTKRHTTIAVGNTNEDTSIVGTSDEYMRAEIKKALTEDEIPAKSKKGNHAEENVIEEAEKRNLNLTEIGASRPICIDCEEKIDEKKIKMRTKRSGKKSRNRRS